MKKIFLTIIMCMIVSVCFAGRDNPIPEGKGIYGNLYGVNIWQEEQTFLDGIIVGGDNSRITFSATGAYIESADTDLIATPNGLSVEGVSKQEGSLEQKITYLPPGAYLLSSYPDANVIQMSSSTGTATLFMTDPTVEENRSIDIVCDNSTSNFCKMSPSGFPIDGSASTLGLSQYDSLTLYSDGDEWLTKNKNISDPEAKESTSNPYNLSYVNDDKVIFDTSGEEQKTYLPAGFNGNDFTLYSSSVNFNLVIVSDGSELIDGSTDNGTMSNGVRVLTYFTGFGWR